ncbi:hypothetical protein EAO76_26320 [Streptomyces sp. sk2.1]|nr:hypothetical protein EAO76_26320 [Streptomyces sp. sk2.1]
MLLGLLLRLLLFNRAHHCILPKPYQQRNERRHSFKNGQGASSNNKCDPGGNRWRAGTDSPSYTATDHDPEHRPQ